MLVIARRLIASTAPLLLALLGWLNAAAADPAPPSPVEAAFSARAGTALALFGYDLFANADTARDRAALGAVRDDYRIGPGDTLTVTLRGDVGSSRRYAVDGEGQLLVEALPPVAAAGRTLGELRAALEAAVAATLTDARVYVSLAEVRRIGVLVVGAVERPGLHEVSALASVLDALIVAGGVRRDGSLRRIRLVRPGGGGHAVDLYDLLLAGSGGDERLQDGDRLVVPPLGPTVAVAGAVPGRAVFELAPARPRLSLNELATLAGTPLRQSAAHRALRLSIAANGAETAEEVAPDDADAPLFGGGDLLVLTPLQENRRGVVHRAGHVLRPGPLALEAVGTLGALVTEADLGPTPYLPFAALVTTDPQTHARVLRPVDLGAVLDGRDDRPLADGDSLVVLGAEDVDFLTAEPVLRLLRGGRPPTGACRGLAVLARALAADPEGPLAHGPAALAAGRLTGGAGACPAVYDEVPDLLLLALEHAVLLRTGVPRPGFYPTVGGAAAAALARAAGRDGAAGRAETRYDSLVDRGEPLVELLGHVRDPGALPLADVGSLRTLLSGDALLPGVYPLLGVVERFDPRTLATAYLAFSPREVAAGRADRRLREHDRVHLFAEAAVRAALAGDGGADDAGDAAPGEPPAGDAAGGAEEEAVEAPDGAPLDPALAAFLAGRAVAVRGAVLRPGAYPVADGASVDDLLASAGGPTPAADPSGVEVTVVDGAKAERRFLDLRRGEAAAVRLRPGDAVRVNPRPAVLETRAVTILGAVRRPGTYDVAIDERLSSLIARAGGLTEDAYPYGTVFTRERERRRKKEELVAQARALEAEILRAEQAGEPREREALAEARRFAQTLRGVEPVGRIVVCQVTGGLT
ncbi:SLBB domain-containing protein [Azospirillum sp. A39]|uniref:SLBB domain-containing protein n=1 Tax=Azospirillum sp. A39 TaxID=3462279 RepID=UPI004045DA5C